MKIPTVIFRLKTDRDGIIVPGTEYLARNVDALFSQAEWSWVEEIDEAYHFEDTQPAETHLELLKAEGVQHGHTMPFGGDHRAARAERQRSQGHNGHGMRLAPDEAYARTQRILGERD